MNENEQNKEPLNKDFKEPKLRFKDFNDSWVTVQFSRLADLRKEKIRLTRKVRLGLPDIELDSIESKTANIVKIYSSDEFESAKCVFKKGDVLYSKLRPYLKKYFLANFDGVASTEFWVFVSKSIEPIFLLFLVELDSFNLATNKTCGTKMPRADWSVVKNLYFPIPKSLKEQAKLGLFLSKVDRKINLIKQEINILKKYIEGIVNRWFSNTGSKKKLSDLVFQKTSQLLTNEIKENSGIYPVYDASGKVYKYVDFFSNDCDSIAIIKYGSGCGRTFIARGKHNVLGTMTEMVPLNHNDLLYIEAYTSSYKFKSVSKKYTEIGTTPNLYFSDYSSSLVFYPKDRTKFTSLLFLFDVLESNLNERLSLLEKIKKYLLKNMFI